MKRKVTDSIQIPLRWLCLVVVVLVHVQVALCNTSTFYFSAKANHSPQGAGKVYISDVLYARVKERVDVEEVGTIPLKGKSNGVFVYSVTAVHKDIPAPSPEEMARRRELYCIAGNMPEE